MPDLEVATAEASYIFSENDEVSIGRRDDNRVVVADPTVSRQHAVIRFESGSWVLEDLSGGRTFHNGGAVSRLVVDQSGLRLNLAVPDGPWLSVSLRHDSGPTAVSMPYAGLGAAPSGPPPGAAAYSAPIAQPFVQVPGAAAPAPPHWTPLRPGAPSGAMAPPAPGPRAKAGAFASVDSDQIKRALRVLFPYRSWIENAGWHQGIRALFVVYAMLPVIFVTVFWNTTNFQTLGWVYALYTAPVWLLVFWYLIKPEDTKRTLAITGAVVAVIVLLIMAGPLQWYYAAIPSPEKTPGDWFSWLIAPGFAEEGTKDGATLISVLAAGYYFKKTLGVRSCMFLGTIAGLAFGAREAALYQYNDLNLFNVSSGPHALVQYVLEFSLRIFTDGLQHAEWAGIACFFIGLGLNYTRRRVPLILFGFAFGAILHATNDWSTGESHWLWLILQVLSAVLFLGYTLFAPSIEAEVRGTDLFRGDSILADQMPYTAAGQPYSGGGEPSSAGGQPYSGDGQQYGAGQPAPVPPPAGSQPSGPLPQPGSQPPPPAP
jgi:RsiW-degrading membrane proteinase PrsW (M82 family)